MGSIYYLLARSLLSPSGIYFENFTAHKAKRDAKAVEKKVRFEIEPAAFAHLILKSISQN